MLIQKRILKNTTTLHSHRNSRNCLLLIPLLLLLFISCPQYSDYTEFTLSGDVLTNIHIQGNYVPPANKDIPVQVYYTDTTFDYGFLNSKGEVWITDTKTANLPGKTFHSLYLRNEKITIRLGRLFNNKEPIELLINDAGALQFRNPIPNPNDSGEPYTPLDTLGEIAAIDRDQAALGGKYIQTHNLNMKGTNWKPVGSQSSPFTGKFDGAGKKLENLTIDREDEPNAPVGFFGVIGAGAKVRNINVASGSVLVNTVVGAVVGQSAGGTIENCSSDADVHSDTYGAGIVGSATDTAIKGCSNSGSVGGSVAGGICGWANANTVIEDCYNTGNVSSGQNLGGIVGNAANTIIKGCVNGGLVDSSGRAGGICAAAAANTSIEDCRNTGNVSSSSNGVGGIVGYMNAGPSVKNCSNRGEVSSYWYAGGIVGYSDDAYGVIACYNAGPVAAADWMAGGIVGYNLGNPIKACYNTGSISGSEDIGGIAGENHDSTISACYSTGSVAGTVNEGGVVGLSSDEYGTSTLTDCYFDNFAGDGIGYADYGAANAGWNKFNYPPTPWPTFSAGDWTASFWKPFSSGEYPRLVWEKN